MSSFDYFWQLVEHHGNVAKFYKMEASRVWSEYTLEQQREIYRSIRDRLGAGKFVSFNPAKAIIENAPQKTKKELRTLSGKEADIAKAQGVKVVVAQLPDGTFKMVLKQDADVWGLKVVREF